MNSVRLAADMNNLSKMREHVVSCAAAWHLPDDKLSKVELVMEELLVNIIEYAYPNGGGEIEIQCSGEDSKVLHILIFDWGRPFDPTQKDDPDLDLNLAERKIGGLGIFFVKQMADELQYERQGDKNILSVSFKAF